MCFNFCLFPHFARATTAAAYANGAQIVLDRNQLKGLDQSVFKSLLDYFKKNNIKASISIGNSTNKTVPFLHQSVEY